MAGLAPMPAALFLAILVAVLSWLALVVCQTVLPARLLAAQMREQAPGTVPIRQLGGLVLVPLYLAGLAMAAARFPEFRPMLTTLGASAALLFLVGLADDHRHQPISLRLAAQFVAAIAVALTLDADAVLTGGYLPWWLERAVLVLGLVYFINMTNFMDGMDLMTVAGLGLPLLLSLTLFAGTPVGDPLGLATLVLAAAIIGFGMVNRPPARLYLGDNGSLPLGLAAGTLCTHLAFAHGLVAALLPFGYYLVDSLSTLAIRARRGENLLRSHSSHAYQVARRAGRSQWWIVAHVIALNLVLVAGAHLSAAASSVVAQAVLAVAGIAACLVVIARFRMQAEG